jgi:hypothetical protein
MGENETFGLIANDKWAEISTQTLKDTQTIVLILSAATHPADRGTILDQTLY